MPSPSDKIMFEIYRESGYDRQFRVVFFTELDEHNKEKEINRALAGEHLYDGFIKEQTCKEGKELINEVLKRLNSGETLLSTDIEGHLQGVLA